MNHTLKFSGAHVIAFLILLFIGYISLLGVTFETGHGLISGILTSAMLVALLALLFLGLQRLKATDKKFRTKIRRERLLLALSPILYYALMCYFIDFWKFHTHADEISQSYSSALQYTGTLFTDYENYAQKRIQNYEHLLHRIVKNRYLRPGEYRACGFKGQNDAVQIQNKVDILHTQLLSDNYKRLKQSAEKWRSYIATSSIWNVAMSTNAITLKQQLEEWEKALNEFTVKTSSDETFGNYNTVTPFTLHSTDIDNIINMIKNIKDGTDTGQETSPYGHSFTLIFYFLLLLPYFLQPRHTKSVYRLLSKKKVQTGISLDEPQDVHKPSTSASNPYGAISLNEPTPRSHKEKTTNKEHSNDGSFTL